MKRRIRFRNNTYSSATTNPSKSGTNHIWSNIKRSQFWEKESSKNNASDSGTTHTLLQSQNGPNLEQTIFEATENAANSGKKNPAKTTHPILEQRILFCNHKTVQFWNKPYLEQHKNAPDSAKKNPGAQKTHKVWNNTYYWATTKPSNSGTNHISSKITPPILGKNTPAKTTHPILGQRILFFNHKTVQFWKKPYLEQHKNAPESGKKNPGAKKTHQVWKTHILGQPQNRPIREQTIFRAKERLQFWEQKS